MWDLDGPMRRTIKFDGGTALIASLNHNNLIYRHLFKHIPVAMVTKPSWLKK